MAKSKTIIVALAGNPNSGKTSLFNELVGANLKVGNWAGVTIEKVEGIVEYQGYKIKIVDLPGTYSLTAYSPEELIARDFIIKENPDVVINVVDGTNLERSLLFTTQLMELEANIIVAMNMFDDVQKNGIKIDIKQLQVLLGSHVIPVSALKRTGLENLLNHVIRVFEKDITIKKNKVSYNPKTEELISSIEEILRVSSGFDAYSPRWLAIKALENDKEIYNLLKDHPVWMKISKLLTNAYEKNLVNDLEDPEIMITNDRNAFVRGAMRETVTFSKKQRKSLTEWIDSIVINRVLGLPIFLLVIWGVFQFTFQLGEAPMAWIEYFFEVLSNWLKIFIPEGIFRSVIIDGMLAGVGGVLVFLPNIVLLFIALSFLEGTGYMARAAFVIDKVMHVMGLHGKSFLPMITGFGCSIPAIMGTRTLKNKGDRLVTIMIIPFMSCGAKLPVYILLIGAFFPPQVAGNILFGIYMFGMMIAIITAKLLKTTVFKGNSEPFVMELPVYRLPTFKSLFIQSKIKAEMYIRKAGTIILVASLLIWIASNFPFSQHLNENYQEKILAVENSSLYPEVEKQNIINGLEHELASLQLEYSFSGRAGKLIEPVIKPLGFDWRIGISLITGLVAKEVVVSTLSTIYAIGETKEESVDLAKRLQADPGFTRATAMSLMVFVLLYIPCVAAIAVFRKEAGSWKWVGLYSVYALSLAWIVSFVVYQISSRII